MSPKTLVRLAGTAATLIPVALAVAEPPVVASVEHNGVMYPVRKLGDGSKLYQDGARWLTDQELRAHVAAQAPRVVTGALAARLAAVAPGEAVEVTIVLRSQPAAPIAREVWSAVEPRVGEIAGAMRRLTASGRPGLSLPREGEAIIPEPPMGAADAPALRALAQERDDLDRDARRLIADRVAAAVAPQQDALAGVIAQLGGQVTARVSIANIVGARLPAHRVAALAANPLVAIVDFNHPGEPELGNSALALEVNTGFWAAGIGGGVFDAGVLDTGVQQNHPALLAHTYVSNMGATDTGTHGTMMAGIMASTDAVNRGMAFGLDKIAVALAGDINTSMPGMAFIASTGEPEAVNYSFGNGTANTSDYSTTDQFFDGVIDTFGYTVSKSTGNGGFGTGAPTITHPAPAFNLMACANQDDKNTPTRADDWISSSSSRGPTLGGRKKPDIGAPGTNILSCNKNWTPTSLWSGCTGTSCAAPHVGGAVVLLFDAGVPSVAAAKAILINTADAINDNGTSSTADDAYVPGSLWNRRYGWGYMNLGAAYAHRADVFSGAVPDEPENADFRLFAGPMFTNEKATLVWQRHVAYNGATFPTQIESLSDLDLTAWRESDNGAVASSASAIDNVEQIGAPADGFVVLKVEAAGTFDPDVTDESFALATQENFTARTGPALSPIFTPISNVAPGAQFQVSVAISNTGDLDAHAVQATLIGANVVSGDPPPISVIPDGAGAPVQWTVQAPVVAGPFQITVQASSSSYGETFTGQGGIQVMVGGCYPDCNADGAVNVADFGCFQTKFVAGDPYADCNGDGTLTVTDFGCFQTKFVLGCP